MERTVYITPDLALALHATVLGLTRGSIGVRDMHGLLGCLGRPQASFGGKEQFPTLYDKAAALIESVARHHPFIDGNKRTAYLIGAHFLSLNGYSLAPKKGEIEILMIELVEQKTPLAEIAAWLETQSKKL